MGRKARGGQAGRPKLIVGEHTIPLVREILQLTRGHKDYVITMEADIADSFLSTLRQRPLADPGVGKMARIADSIGYELVLRPKLKGGKLK